MKRLIRVTLACALIAALLCCACAQGMSTSQKQDAFNRTLSELEAYIMDLTDNPARLNAIATQFYSLGGFPQSRQFWYYVSVLSKVTAAEFDMELTTYLYSLSQMKAFDEYIASLGNTPLCGVTELTSYARGREAEYNGYTDAAIGHYAQCMGFFDAADRYNTLVMGKAASAYERGVNCLRSGNPAGAYFAFLESGEFGEARAMLSSVSEQLGYTPENADDNPGRVYNLKAKSVNTDSVTLEWEEAAHASRYTVEYRLSGDSAYLQAGETSNTVYTVSGLNPNSAYDFLVTAYAGSFKTEGALLSNVLTAASNPTPKPTPTPTPKPTPTPTTTPSVKVGDTVTFGSYEQDNNTANGKEPIEWEVLDVESDGTCLLISKYAIDGVLYNTERKDITWETCTLRSWLNDDFYNNAFNTGERAKIAITKNVNAGNPVYGTSGGNDTDDCVFLLSLEEIEKYYNINRSTGEKAYWYGEKRLRKLPTAYARTLVGLAGNGVCWWWLRSIGDASVHAAYVDEYGNVRTFGEDVYWRGGGIVPAVRVRLFN
ncbi:MAG: fibronectin type III domain-containing protein [Clostridia bacterium]|nr:fibronectin type III domain-containing protein [Clostridia bacterium]